MGMVVLVLAVPKGDGRSAGGLGIVHCSCWFSFPPNEGKTLKESGHSPYVKTFLEAAETSCCTLLLSWCLKFGATL